MDAPDTPRRRLPRWLLLAGLGPAGFGVLSIAGRFPDAVEAVYSRRVFPALRGLLVGAARAAPVSAAEALCVLAAAVVLWRAARGVRAVARRQLGAAALAARAVRQLLAAAGVGYALFLALWGLNHARQPYAHHAGLRVTAPAQGELATLLLELVVEANELRERIDVRDLEVDGRAGHVDARLAAGYAALAAEVPALRGSPPLVRFPWCSPVLTRLGISGIYVPFTGEAHVNARIPVWARPFIACHEVAHQRGFAREDEANFIAWQVCRAAGDDAFRYSATYVAVGHVAAALRRENEALAAELLSRLSPAVAGDREASARFWSAHHGRLSELSASSNDLYLRSQGQADGVRSYGRMVDLLLAERRAGLSRAGGGGARGGR
jgi:hypothetical protein